MAYRYGFLFPLLLGIALTLGCSDDTTGVPDGGPGGDQSVATDGQQLDDSGRPLCEGDEQLFHAGCEPASGFVAITDGCYAPCTGADDTSCPANSACREAWINPCVCDPTPGVSCCAACGASQWLCISKTVPYALDDVDALCDDGFSAKDVLDSLESSYAATLTYANDAETALTLSLAREGGSLLCYPEILAPPGSAAPDLPAHIEIEVQVTLKTDDGFFDESFTTVLDGQLAWANFSEEMMLSALGGSYTPSDTTHTKITFQASFHGATAQGTIRTHDASSVGPNIGAWATAGR